MKLLHSGESDKDITWTDCRERRVKERRRSVMFYTFSIGLLFREAYPVKAREKTDFAVLPCDHPILKTNGGYFIILAVNDA